MDQETQPKTGLIKSQIGNSEIELVIHARKQKKISDCGDAEIESVIKYLMVLSGISIKDVPTGIEKTVMLDFIRQSYGNEFSCEQLRQAFVWGISGKIEVDKELYGKSFSSNYISRFLDAYRKKLKELRSENKNIFIDSESLDEKDQKLIFQSTGVPVSDEQAHEYAERAKKIIDDIANKKNIEKMTTIRIPTSHDIFMRDFEQKILSIDLATLYRLKDEIVDDIHLGLEADAKLHSDKLRIVEKRIAQKEENL